MFLISFNYFNKKGEQKSKIIKGATLGTLQKQLSNYDIYFIHQVNGKAYNNNEVKAYIDTLGWDNRQGNYSIDYNC